MRKFWHIHRLTLELLIFGLVFLPVSVAQATAPPAPNPQSGVVGVEGQINGAAPTQAATIGVPGNGQHFTTLPITVSGSCPSGLLIEIFDNNVFVGSAQCTGGSFSLQVDLFEGQNDLIARDYDALNQQGPDSNTVTVFFSSSLSGSASRPTLTTAYAKRGADPNTLLTWPITLSGGAGPYAISVDWGDKSPQDLISRQTAGNFDIEHTYSQSGIFNVTVKVVDANGAAAFLQLVGISNGPIQQNTGNNNQNGGTKIQKEVIWWPVAITLLLSIVTFWLGKKHQLETIRGRLRRGERPI